MAFRPRRSVSVSTVVAMNSRPSSFTLLTKYPTASATMLPAAIWPRLFLSRPAARSVIVIVPLNWRISRSSSVTLALPCAMATASASPVSLPLAARVCMAALVSAISCRTTSTGRTLICAKASLTRLVLAASSCCLRSAESRACSQKRTYSADCSIFLASAACFSNACTDCSSCMRATMSSVALAACCCASFMLTMASASRCHAAASATALALAAA